MTDRGRTRSVSASPETGAADSERPGGRARDSAPAPHPEARLAADDRGQTVQDFAIGASVFLLTIAFVFAFIPTLFTPFEDDVAAGLGSQASRTAASIVDNGSIDGRSNWMTQSSAQEAIVPDENGDGTYGASEDLQNKYDLPETSQVNVTVTPMPPDDESIIDGDLTTLPIPIGDDDLASGDEFRDRPAATVSRIVVVEGVPECDPQIDADTSEPGTQGQACRMTVRIW